MQTCLNINRRIIRPGPKGLKKQDMPQTQNTLKKLIQLIERYKLYRYDIFDKKKRQKKKIKHLLSFPHILHRSKRGYIVFNFKTLQHHRCTFKIFKQPKVQ